MKKVSFFLLVLFAVQFSFAQTKNGVVYNEHPSIKNTEKLWAALLKGDKETYQKLFADSAIVIYNGGRNLQPIAKNIEGMDWWSKSFTNLTVADDKPAFPDAIEYEKGGLWVQDWIRVKGIHEKTGVQLDLAIHNLYSFNKDGKITSFHLYFNNDVFEDIRESQTTRENGTVYINHPYIAVTRKLVNAFCSNNLDAMGALYNEKVSFHDESMGFDETKDWPSQRAEWEEYHKKFNNIMMKQIGYPDCIHYAQGDQYVVMSWWDCTATNIETGEKYREALMLSHTYDKDGKVIDDTAYRMSKTEMK